MDMRNSDRRCEAPQDVVDLRTAAYYDRIANEYDDQVDGLAINRAMREAFRVHVSELAGPSGRILDFGCGTGTDAEWYAEKGHQVVAYDISPGMVNVLRARCSGAIAAGRITPLVGSSSDFEHAMRGRRSVDVVAANFGVLNHVHDLQSILVLLASHLRPGGALVASLLNPLYRGQMSWRGWLRTQAMWAWRGAVTLRGEVTTHRLYLHTLRRRVRPVLELVEVGHLDERGDWSAESISWRQLLSEEFRFVTLRRIA